MTYLAVHVYLNNGAIILERYGLHAYEKKKVWHPNFNQVLKKVLHYFKFAERCRGMVYKYGKPPYVWFGTIYLIIVVAPYFIGIKEPAQYADLLITLRFFAIIMCALLVTESIWPEVMYRYLPTFWYITLIYCLPFLSITFILLTGGAIEYIISVAVLTVLLIAIINWVSAISIAAIGVGAAVYFYKCYVCKNYNVESQELEMRMIYLLGFELACATTIGMIFLRKKQDAAELIRSRNAILKFQMKSLSSNLHESLSVEEKVAKGFGTPGVDMVERLADMEKFYGELKEYAKDAPKEKQFDKKMEEMKKTVGFLTNLSKRSREYLKLKVRTVPLDDFLALINEIASTYILYSRYSIVIRTRVKEIQCDDVQLSHVFSNIFHEIFNLNLRDELITIEVSDTSLIYTMSSLPNYEKRVEALQFTISTAEHLDKSYYPVSYQEQEKNPRDVLPIEGLSVEKIISERIVAAHFGVLKTFEEDFTTAIVVPQKVREVRSVASDAEVPDEKIEISWPGALELENNFIKKLKAKAPAVSLAKVEKALSIIKRYHAPQKRKSGEPYYLHPLHVAIIELEWCQEEKAILGALMHDLLEDTAFSLMDIKTVFGNEVAEVVYKVSKMDAHGRSIFQSNKEHFKTLVEKDFVTLSIKISDRIHNMRTLSGHKSAEKRRQVAQETMDFFVPLAKKLELNKACEELRELAEKELN